VQASGHAVASLDQGVRQPAGSIGFPYEHQDGSSISQCVVDRQLKQRGSVGERRLYKYS
jgi:hypothetical protein